MAYKDASCTEPLKLISRGSEVQGGALDVDVALTDNLRAGHHGYDDMHFPDAEEVGGSRIVYWKAPDTDLNCMNIMMLWQGNPWGAATRLPGDIIINAKNKGCYYSAIPDGADLMTSFCCGRGDCAPANLGTQSFIIAGKRDVENLDAPKENSVSKRLPLSPASHASSIIKAKRAEAPKCKVVGEVKQSITTGPQTAVSSKQTCSGPECKFAVSNSKSFSTSLTVGKSYTFTSEVGMELSITAGVNFIAKSEVTATLQASIAQAWEESSSKTTAEETISGFSQEIGQQPGTSAILTYIPQYTCDRATVECGKDINGNTIRIEDFRVCKPLPDVNEGRYQVVYTS